MEYDTNYPYLQILYYQCMIAEFYDHPLTMLYEFSPRGSTATWVFEQFPANFVRGNPILNNAKAVDILDRSWADSKASKGGGRKPHALLALLQFIERTGYAARKELAFWVRLLIIRVLRILTAEVVELPSHLDKRQIEGAGGLSHGLHQAGIDVIKAFEIDGSASETYQHNFPNTHVVVRCAIY